MGKKNLSMKIIQSRKTSLISERILLDQWRVTSYAADKEDEQDLKFGIVYRILIFQF